MSGKLNYSRQIETCHPGASRTIFDGPGQHVDVDPASIRLISDRCLIRDIPQDDSRRGSLFIPEVAQDGSIGKGGLYRIGLVIAVGPGDSVYEWVEPISERCSKMEALDAVRRKLITQKCPRCEGVGFDPDWPVLPSLIDDMGTLKAIGAKCPEPGCDSGRIPVTVPPQCKPGDTVIFDRRREAEMVFNGERMAMLHAEQSLIGRLDGGHVTPLYDVIFMQRADVPPVGLIQIPDVAREDSQIGIVLKAGPGRRIVDGKVQPLDVSDGDRVLFVKGSESSLTIAGAECLVVRESSVIAVLED